jgi:outer membrane lipase/esterase
MKHAFAWLFATAIACLSGSAGAAAYSNLYIFGDSLSDVGNNFIALGGATTPQSAITGNNFVPDLAPYASQHYSNGAIWAQDFASALHLPAVTPSLAMGNDFAFGGARTSSPNPPPAGTAPGLNLQVGAFLSGLSGAPAPSTGLYIVAGGGNNARDAAAEIVGGADPITTVTNTAKDYAKDIATIVGQLEGAGAQHIVVWNVPVIGQTPYVRSFGQVASAGASFLASSMNDALDLALKGDKKVKIFDLFGAVDAVIDNPAAFGLTNVTDACGQFSNCDPSKYLFWDGIHPTSEGHLLIADALLGTVVPEPSVFVVAAIGLVLLAAAPMRRRH